MLIGAFLAFLSSFIAPYYATQKINEALGGVLKDSAVLLNYFVDTYIDFGIVRPAPTSSNPSELSSTVSNNPPSLKVVTVPVCLSQERLAASPVTIATHLVAALTRIEGKIDKEAAAWRSGPFSITRASIPVLTALRNLVTHAAALQSALERPALLGGAYGREGTSLPHAVFILPLLPHMMRVMEAHGTLMVHLDACLGATAASSVVQDAARAARDFNAAVSDMMVSLNGLRRHMYEQARAAGNTPLDPDDTVLFCGFLYAWYSGEHLLFSTISP